MPKIKKDDDVVIIAGKDKGKRGKVLQVLKQTEKVIVDGINLAKKHVRPNPQRGQVGGIVEMAKPLHISKVAIYNPLTKKADRVGYKFLEDGRKVRIFKSNQEMIDVGV
jgi:large subunit ribosomal protein L24